MYTKRATFSFYLYFCVEWVNEWTLIIPTRTAVLRLIISAGQGLAQKKKELPGLSEGLKVDGWVVKVCSKSRDILFEKFHL